MIGSVSPGVFRPHATAIRIRGVRTLQGALAATSVLVSLFGFAASADTYPNKPIRLVVGYPPAGANDLIARHVAAKLGQRVNTQIVVDNRPGANGILACELVAKSAPDGYTLLFAGKTPLVLNPLTYAKLPYDTLADYTAISTVASGPVVIVVRPELGPNNLQELIALAKAKPGQLNFATIGTGGFTRIFFELFKSTAKIDVRYVPYKGAAQAIPDVVTGRVEAMSLDLAPLMSTVKSGRLRALAITSAHRNPELPDVRTVSEQGMPQLTGGNWYAVLGPRNLPAPITATLHAALVKGMNAPDSKERLAAVGVDPMTSASPQALTQYIRSEFALWGPVVKAANIKSE